MGISLLQCMYRVGGSNGEICHLAGKGGVTVA